MIYKNYNYNLTPEEEAEFLNTLPIFKDAKLNQIIERRGREQHRINNYQAGRDAWLG